MPRWCRQVGRPTARGGGNTEKTKSFVTWAQGYAETQGLYAFMSVRWPKYAGDYPLGEEISRRTIAEGLYDNRLHPESQVGLPCLYFKLRAAMSGVVFKLCSEGIK